MIVYGRGYRKEPEDVPMTEDIPMPEEKPVMMTEEPLIPEEEPPDAWDEPMPEEEPEEIRENPGPILPQDMMIPEERAVIPAESREEGGIGAQSAPQGRGEMVPPMPQTDGEPAQEEIPFTPRPLPPEETQEQPLDEDSGASLFTPQQQEEAREFLEELERQGEEMNGSRSRPEIIIPESENAEISADQTAAPMTGLGVLVAQVTTANGSLPVENARVTVTRSEAEGDHLVGYVTTNENGISKELELPTPPRELSSRPSDEIPFALYNVSVEKEGYLTSFIYNMQLFDGEISLQNVNLIPLMEFASPSESYEELDIIPQNL